MKFFVYIQISILLILFQTEVLSQKRSLKNYSKNVFYFGNDSINYRILDPYFVQEKPVPLFIFLHGSGERGNDNNSQLVHGSKFFLKETEKIEYNSYVIFPQCPKNSRWSYHNEDPWISKNKTEDKKSISLYGNLVIELIKHLIKEKNIDKNRIYISGLSMGGYGVFDLVSNRPKIFAAAAPICGGADLDLLQNAIEVPFWIFHGDMDRVVSVDKSRKAYNFLIENSKTNILYTEYKGVYHNAWDYVFNEENFFDWFFKKNKNQY
tara:strand:+ start:130 stop:924 length:795 start_codon:yes stop_codon:yes gene_type:complete